MAFSLYGQGNFKPGYIIDLNQDTIQGEIKSGSESHNAQVCEFRTGSDAEASEYRPGEIQAYRFTNGKYYVTMEVEENGLKKKVFIEYLVNGIADLYYLREQNSEQYYIGKEGEDPLAISDIRMLKAAFSDCYEIQASLDKATLSHNSLISMTEKYHDYVCDGEVCINYAREASRLRLHVMPYAGYSMSTMRFRGDDLFQLFDFEPGKAPVFGVILDVGSNRLGDHVSFQLGTEFSNKSYTGYGERTLYAGDYFTYDVHLNAPFLSFRFGTRYAFSGSRVRPSLGGGLEGAKFINPDFYFVQTKYVGDVVSTSTWSDNVVENILFGAYLQAGLDVMLAKRLALVSGVRAGFLTSNANIIAGFPGVQVRVRPEMIPVSIHIGLQF